VIVNKRILLARAGKMFYLLTSVFHEKPDGQQERDKKSVAPTKTATFLFLAVFYSDQF
jgi:hypothetical protein